MNTASSTTKPNDDERYLTAAEVAARWRVHIGSIYRLAKQSRIPSVTLFAGSRRRCIRFPMTAILELEAEGRAG